MCSEDDIKSGVVLSVVVSALFGSTGRYNSLENNIKHLRYGFPWF